MFKHTKQSYLYSFEAKISIQNKVYNPAKRYYKNRLVEIVEKNNMIHGSQFGKEGGIIYKGKEYKLPMKYNNWARSYIVDESLVGELDKYIDETLQLEREQKTVNRMLSNLFSEDIPGTAFNFILGDSLYSISSNTLNKLNYKKEINQEELIKLKDKYSQLVEILQNRIVTNLISQGLYNDA